MKKIFIKTHGCQMNHYDSSRIADLLCKDNFLTLTSLENEAGKTFNGHCYIFNANNSSEYTFITVENGYLADDGTFLGEQGGGVYTQTTTVDGVNISFDTGNIDAGTFKLYGLKK